MKKQNRSNQSLFWIDFVRVSAIFSMVLLHSAGPLIYRWEKIPLDWWLTGNLFDSLMRMCVPLLLMVSGVLLLGKQEAYSVFYAKRVKRIAIPWMAWTLVYLGWDVVFTENALTVPTAVRKILEGSVYYHLWFLYLIAGLYLVTPIFRLFVAKAKPKDMIYLFILWLVWASLVPFIERYLEIYSRPLYFGLKVPEVAGYIGYFVMGHFLRELCISKKMFLQALGLFVFAGVYTAIATYQVTVKTGEFNHLFYNNMSPNVILLTVSAFIAFKYIGEHFQAWMPDTINHAFGAVVKNSFGIYLCHVIVLEGLQEGMFGFQLSGIMQHPVYMIPLTAVVIFSITFFIVEILRKIPFVKETV